MNPPKVSDQDYINFLIATPKTCSGTEAARVQPDQEAPPAHDAFTRLLHRLEPDPATLWQEAATQVERGSGVLVIDDSTLDKPYAKQMELVSRHWSGNHHAVVKGIKESSKNYFYNYNRSDSLWKWLTTNLALQKSLRPCVA